MYKLTLQGQALDYYVQKHSSKEAGFASIHIAKYTSTLNGFILGAC